MLTFMWLWEWRPILDDGRKILVGIGPWRKCAHASLLMSALAHTCTCIGTHTHTHLWKLRYIIHNTSFLTACWGSVCSFSLYMRTCANARVYQVTLGLFGQEEEVISNPLSPGVIQGIIYRKCSAHGGEREAVLQQELVIHIGWIISNNPELFSGMLKIRVG